MAIRRLGARPRNGSEPPVCRSARATWEKMSPGKTVPGCRATVALRIHGFQVQRQRGPG